MAKWQLLAGIRKEKVYSSLTASKADRMERRLGEAIFGWHEPLWEETGRGFGDQLECSGAHLSRMAQQTGHARLQGRGGQGRPPQRSGGGGQTAACGLAGLWPAGSLPGTAAGSPLSVQSKSISNIVKWT